MSVAALELHIAIDIVLIGIMQLVATILNISICNKIIINT